MTGQICKRCVMDQSDWEITFDTNGICSHCQRFDTETAARWFPNEIGSKKLEKIIEDIKKDGREASYDCILGVSGGVDSSYLALLLKNYNLRVLALHVDAGWNSEEAVHNIERLVKHCDFDLHTEVINWPEIRDLQRAYLRSGVANQDVPQDHAFFASLYRFATKNKIKHVISGGNIATESVFPDCWHHSAMDAISLRDIHRRFGEKPLTTYPTVSFTQYYLTYPFIKRMRVIRPLNFMRYDKGEALEELKKTVGYKPYDRKHGESRFTKFFQNFYLPEKFDIDKRKAHLSSMILSGQISREEAVAELAQPLYEPSELAEDKIFVSKKLNISLDELEALVVSRGVDYRNFKSWDTAYGVMTFAKKTARKLGVRIKSYG